jgi:hypothetical protein
MSWVTTYRRTIAVRIVSNLMVVPDRAKWLPVSFYVAYTLSRHMAYIQGKA